MPVYYETAYDESGNPYPVAVYDDCMPIFRWLEGKPTPPGFTDMDARMDLEYLTRPYVPSDDEDDDEE